MRCLRSCSFFPMVFGEGRGGKSWYLSYCLWPFSKFKDGFWLHLFACQPKLSTGHMAELWCNSLLYQLCVFYLNKDKNFQNLCRFKGKWMYQKYSQTCTGIWFSRNAVSDLNQLLFESLDLKYVLSCFPLCMSESSLLLWTMFLFVVLISDRVLPPPEEAVVLNFCNWTCA